MYDYVIVGAGSAGCVVANRLGEDPDVRVAVIEAGPPDDAPEIHIPAAFGPNLTSDWDWALFSEPEPGLDHRRNYLPRGRVVGGSSSLNAMIYIRGNRADYDEWAAMGFAGWGYEDVLPYFKRAEDNERGASRYHGVGGPLSVSDSRSMHPVVEAWVEAAGQAGIPHNGDLNGATQEGAGRYQVTQRDGRRCSAAVAYLHPAVARGNVEVVTDARVYRILFEGTRAVGVEYMRHGTLEQVRAGREVILSAGAYHSPQLLMLSGVGPAEALTPLNMATFHELPVGQNLQDHVMLNFVCLTDKGSLISSLDPGAFELFEAEGRGPVSSNGGEGGAFVRTRDGPRGARRAVPHRLPAAARGVPRRALRRRLHLRPGGGEADEPRPGHPALAAAARAAADRPQLPDDRRGPREHDRRRAAELRDRRRGGAEGVAAGRLPRAEVRLRGATSWTSSSAAPTPCTTRWAAARWGRWSTTSCGSSASRACAWSTPR